MKFEKSTKITVTGGAGLIGSELVKLLHSSGADVTIIDDFSKGKIENLIDILPEIEVLEGDLEDPDFAKSSIKKCDYFFHLASRAYGVGYGEGHHLEILEHNERITTNVISCLTEQLPGKLLISSSSCVYPDDGPDILTELPLFTSEPETVNRGYGWAKRFLEQKCTLFAEETNIPLVIFRPFNIYGENYCWAGKYSQAIPMLVKRIIETESEIEVWGSGNQRRSYLHAHDCAQIMVDLAKHPSFTGPVNIGTSDTVSIKELVELIAEVNNLSRKFVFDTTKPEGRKIKSSDTELLESLVGKIQPSIDLREGLKRMRMWYEQNFKQSDEQ